VEGGGHDAVGGVEGLFHAVPVVNVNVNVQHALVVPGIEVRPTEDTDVNDINLRLRHGLLSTYSAVCFQR